MLAQQADAISHDRASLPPIGGNHHDGGAFPGTEERSPVAEAGEENRDQSEDEDLPDCFHKSASFVRRLRSVARCGQCVVGRSQALLSRHRQREQRCEKRAPCAPSVAIEERTKHLGIVERAQDVHGASRSIVRSHARRSGSGASRHAHDAAGRWLREGGAGCLILSGRDRDRRASLRRPRGKPRFKKFQFGGDHRGAPDQRTLGSRRLIATAEINQMLVDQVFAATNPRAAAIDASQKLLPFVIARMLPTRHSAAAVRWLPAQPPTDPSADQRRVDLQMTSPRCRTCVRSALKLPGNARFCDPDVTPERGMTSKRAEMAMV